MGGRPSRTACQRFSCFINGLRSATLEATPNPEPAKPKAVVKFLIILSAGWMRDPDSGADCYILAATTGPSLPRIGRFGQAFRARAMDPHSRRVRPFVAALAGRRGLEIKNRLCAGRLAG